MRLAIFQILLLQFLSISFLYGHPSPITIVKNHQPKALIVVPDSASSQIQNAAKILQKYIQESTGALLPISSHPQKNVTLEVGFTAFIKSQGIDIRGLDEDGFILKQVNSQHFIILGGSDWGTEFGVYSFLERFLRIYWLMPSAVGIDIPKKATLTLPRVKIIDNPKYISRQISPLDIEAKTDLGTWTRYNRLKGRIAFHHNLLNLFDPKEFWNSNPDFYPRSNGHINKPMGYSWQPNFSAPGIVDSAAVKIIYYFKANPKTSSYSLGINDFSGFDESPSSLARRRGRKNYLDMEDVSDDYFQWVNEVAEKVLVIYPDKYFGLLAYNNVAEPPSTNIGVNAHVIPFLTYERSRWSDALLERQGHQLTKAWAKECSALGWYDYIYGLDYLVPRVWFHRMQDYIKWGAKHKVKYYYAELYPNWGEGPKAWILGKLLWNPNQNVDSLLNVWYVATAGKKAAPKLKEYYQLWEKFWSDDIFKSSWNNNKGQYLNFNNISYLNDVPKDYVSRCDDLINNALTLSETTQQKQRVSKLKDMWQLYKMAIEIYKDPAVPENKRQQNLLQSSQFIALLNSLENDPFHVDSIKWIKQYLNIKG